MLHTAIILARAPKEFINTYIPEIVSLQQKQQPLILDISHIISLDLFVPLLRFWYTASFCPSVDDPSRQSSTSYLNTETLIDTSSRFAPSSTSTIHKSTPLPADIKHELEQLGIDLGTALLPPYSESVPDFIQLVSDLKALRNDNTTTDVTILLVSNDGNTILSTYPTHRFILAAQSPYFHALFCASFQEASRDTVHLTSDLFNDAIIDLMLNFFYTDKIIVEEPPQMTHTKSTFSPHQRRLQHQKHALRVVQKAYYAADFLSQYDNTFVQALLYKMACLCHQFKCVCSDCAVLLPSMLAWSDKHAALVPELRRALIVLYSDPVHSLAPLWSQRPFSHLVSSMASKDNVTLCKRGGSSKTLVKEIEERTLYNVTKHNAIHVLHSLHLCLSQIRTVDHSPTWSRPVFDLLLPILKYTVSMVSQFFDFYCVEYPILLSCVDGIGGGFSVDFLDFLLLHVLNEGISFKNAGVIYQGLVRDLYGRQEVVKNMAIDDVLIKARLRCAAYIAKYWTRIKSEGGFRSLEKSVMRQLAEDVGVSYRSLTKPSYYDTDFAAAIFTNLKPKNKSVKNKKEGKDRRLSIGNLMTKTSSVMGETRPGRPRALSTESALVSSFRQYRISSENEEEKQNQPLLNMLSYETLKRAKMLEEQDHGVVVYQKQIKNKTKEKHATDEPHRPFLRTSSSFTSLTDQLLLPSPPGEKEQRPEERPSRLRFELPTVPVRALTGVNSLFQPQPRCRSRSSSGVSYHKSCLSTEEEVLPRIGYKIELLHRPLPTMGTVKFIGPVQFAEGNYIGIELENRCK